MLRCVAPCTRRTLHSRSSRRAAALLDPHTAPCLHSGVILTSAGVQQFRSARYGVMLRTETNGQPSVAAFFGVPAASQAVLLADRTVNSLRCCIADAGRRWISCGSACSGARRRALRAPHCATAAWRPTRRAAARAAVRICGQRLAPQSTGVRLCTGAVLMIAWYAVVGFVPMIVVRLLARF